MLVTKRNRRGHDLPDLYPFDLASVFEDMWPLETARKDKWIPAMDVSETESEYKVRLETPGMDKEDIKVELEDNVLTVSGEKKTVHEDKNEKFYSVERNYGHFARRIRLSDIDGENISASYSNGVLEVTVPKTEAVKPKQIAIK